MPGNSMEEKLYQIFMNVNDWLRFSEAKNAALIAFAAVTLFGAMQTAIGPNCPKPISMCLLSYAVLSGLGLLAALFSFLPQLSIAWLWKTRKPARADNLLFFGHLESYNEKGLIDEIKRKYGLKSERQGIEYDLANQIIQNSKIAMKKYRIFTIALWFVISGILSPVIVIPLYYF